MDKSERVAWFIRQTSRPLSMMVATLAASIAAIIVACKVDNGNDGAFALAAAFTGAAAFVGFKATENWKAKKYESQAEVAKSQNTTGA